MSAIGFLVALITLAYIFLEAFESEDARSKELDQVQKRLAEKEAAETLRVINGLREFPVIVGASVKIADRPATRDIGAAGKTGNVVGVAKASSTHVDVIGTHFVDAAVNVFIDELGRGFWLYPDLVVSAPSRNER